MSNSPVSYNERIQEDGIEMDEKETDEGAGVNAKAKHETDQPNLIEKPKRRKPEHVYECVNDNICKQPTEIDEVSDIDEDIIEATTHKPVVNDGWRWVSLAAAFVILTCIDGVAFSFGLLLPEIAREVNATQAKASLIGSMFIAIPLITGPVMSALVDRLGYKYMSIIAGLATAIAFLLAAVSNSVPTLCLTYGLIGGLTAGILYVTSVISVTLWFDDERDLALSLISCSFGIGPLVFSPMIQHFLNNYHLSDTMVLLGGILLHICVCGALMRSPPSLKKKRRLTLVVNRNSIASKSSLSSKYISNESRGNSDSSSEVDIDYKRAAECNSDPAVLPVQVEPKEPMPSGSEHNKEKEGKNDNKDKSTPISNENRREEKTKKRQQFQDWRRAILSDHNHLRGLSLHKYTMVYRGAMMSTPKYRLRSTLRPDVYSNSDWSLNSEAAREYTPCLRIWITPEIISDHIPTFTKTQFIIFNLCMCNGCAWSIFPYFFLTSFMDELKIHGGSMMLSFIAGATVIGTVFCSWARKQPWMNVKIAHTACLIICGFSILTYPHLIKYSAVYGAAYGAVVFISIVYGTTLAISHSFTTEILMHLMPMNEFTMAYCVVLLVQGLGYLVGPPIGGMLYDVTGHWDGTFLLGGIGLVFAGVCAWLVNHGSIEF